MPNLHGDLALIATAPHTVTGTQAAYTPFGEKGAATGHFGKHPCSYMCWRCHAMTGIHGTEFIVAPPAPPAPPKPTVFATGAQIRAIVQVAQRASHLSGINSDPTFDLSNLNHLQAEAAAAANVDNDGGGGCGILWTKCAAHGVKKGAETTGHAITATRWTRRYIDDLCLHEQQRRSAGGGACLADSR